MLHQTPDASGCITINWPSRNVPHGGVFHSHKAGSSTETAEFLKVLLDESKFASELRRGSRWGLCDGSPERRGAGEGRAAHAPMPRPRTSRRRSLSCIQQSGALEADTWRPSRRGEDREQLKQRLQQLMEWGHEESAQRRAPPPPPARARPKLPTAKDMRQDLLTQIRERAEWLEEMEALGHAAPHRELIRDQIAERVRSLAALRPDTERSRLSDTGSARTGSVRGTARAGAESAGRKPAQGSARSSVHTGRSSVQRPGAEARSRSAAAGQRRGAEESVAAYADVFAPLGRSPRRRS